MKKLSEFENFDRTMRELLKIPHSEIKAKLAGGTPFARCFSSALTPG